jgi:hypothetical protein
LSALGSGLLLAAVLTQVLPAAAARTVVDVALVSVQFIFPYLVSVFVYSDSTLGGKTTGFPPRLFTLPVRTCWLVGWPMLYGTVTAALVWLGLLWLILVPGGYAQSVAWWLALVPAAYLACTQAVCWTLARAPLLRLVVVILVLPSIGLGILLFLATHNLHLTIFQLTLGLCVLIGTAYAVAVAGVARDRRGDRWGWAWLGRLVPGARLPWSPSPYPLPPEGGEGRVRGARERSFASPPAAQRWLEVRRHGWVLPALVGLFLAMLFWAKAIPLSPVEVARVAVAVVGFPAVLAFFVGFGMGKTSFWARDLRLSAFLATRPLTSAALADAKLRAAGWSALATWGLVVLLSPLWAVLSGNVEVEKELAAAAFPDQPAWKLGLLAPVFLAGLVGLTWLQLVAGMALSLTGRSGVVNAFVLLYGAVGAALAGLGVWTASHAEFFDTLLIVLWWLGGGLGLLKLSAAVGAGYRADIRHDHIGVRLLLWLATALCLLVPLYALVPAGPVPTHLLALYMVLALPLTRLIALPAVVAWNRHR